MLKTGMDTSEYDRSVEDWRSDTVSTKLYDGYFLSRKGLDEVLELLRARPSTMPADLVKRARAARGWTDRYEAIVMELAGCEPAPLTMLDQGKQRTEVCVCTSKLPHYCPPSFGEEGYYVCDPAPAPEGTISSIKDRTTRNAIQAILWHSEATRAELKELKEDLYGNQKEA